MSRTRSRTRTRRTKFGPPSFRIATGNTSNAKTRKPHRFNGRRILSGLIHLSPANRSGYETCSGRTKGCTSGCLDTAGHGGIGVLIENGIMLQDNDVQRARIRRTHLLFQDPAEFMRLTVRDVEALVQRAREHRAVPAWRMNATSDIDWTVIPCTRNGRTFRNIFEAFPSVHFYDYTKVRARMFAFLAGELPANYHLTFSRAETKANQITAMQVLQGGGNVAVVFSTRPGEALPETWNGHQVIDGDAHDFRFTDPKAQPGQLGYVIGLRAKGYAKGDASGFVVQVPRMLQQPSVLMNTRETPRLLAA